MTEQEYRIVVYTESGEEDLLETVNAYSDEEACDYAEAEYGDDLPWFVLNSLGTDVST